MWTLLPLHLWGAQRPDFQRLAACAPMFMQRAGVSPAGTAVGGQPVQSPPTLGSDGPAERVAGQHWRPGAPWEEHAWTPSGEASATDGLTARGLLSEALHDLQAKEHKSHRTRATADTGRSLLKTQPGLPWKWAARPWHGPRREARDGQAKAWAPRQIQAQTWGPPHPNAADQAGAKGERGIFGRKIGISITKQLPWQLEGSGKVRSGGSRLFQSDRVLL